MIIVLLTKVVVSPITESTGADSNDVSDMLPSQVGLTILLFTSAGINFTTNAVVLLGSSSYIIRKILYMYIYICYILKHYFIYIVRIRTNH